MDIENCTTFVGFSYRSDGWNPHVATAHALLANPDLKYHESPLAHLYETFQPKTLQELFLEGAEEDFEPLCSLPTVRAAYRYVWALSPSRIRAISTQAEPEGHHYFGPLTADNALNQFDRLRLVLESIQEQGFRPVEHGMIGGYFLANGDDYRFVVGAGNHRLAVLRVLGHKTVPVSLLDSHPAVIDRSRIPTWSIDRGGPFQSGTAEALFEKLMTEDGLAKARKLGLAA